EVHALQMREVVPAELGLDLEGGAEDREAHGVVEGSFEEREDDQRGREPEGRYARGALADSIDRQLQRPRGQLRHEDRCEDRRIAPQVGPPMAMDVAP